MDWRITNTYAGMVIFLSISLVAVLLILTFVMGVTVGRQAKMQKLTDSYMPLFMPGVIPEENDTVANRKSTRR